VIEGVHPITEIYNPAIRVLEVCYFCSRITLWQRICRCKSWLQILICNFMVNMLMNNMWIVKVGRMIVIDETYLIWVTHFSVWTWFAEKSRFEVHWHNALPILAMKKRENLTQEIWIPSWLMITHKLLVCSSTLLMSFSLHPHPVSVIQEIHLFDCPIWN